MKKEFIMPSMKIAGFKRESILTASNVANAIEALKNKGMTEGKGEEDKGDISIARINLQ